MNTQNRPSLKIPIAAWILVLAWGILIPYRLSAQSDIRVRVDSRTGNYSIHSETTGWTFAGSIGKPLSGMQSGKGRDAIGTYRSIRFRWKSNIPFQGSIRWYEQVPVVLFSYKLPQGSLRSPGAFPDFSSIPDSLYHFSYRNINFAPPEFSLEQSSTPWLLFNGRYQACVISPASDFIVSLLSGDGKTRISSGLNPGLQNLPAGFTHSTILVCSQGIHSCWDTWGRALRALYHRKRPSNESDRILKYFGYWTDNGADYYYHYDTTKGYEGTLLAVRDQYRRRNIPLGYMQLDSWWYDKSIYDPDGKPDAGHMNPGLPAEPWNRYGGLMRFQADSFLFPGGLASFQHRLGLPLVTHNRWIDPRSPYHRQFRISGFAATDTLFWQQIMQYLQRGGVKTYEQDWLNFIYNKSPRMATDLAVGNEFTDGMARAAKARGIDLQYCMAMPRFFLQGLNYDNLTTIRTSDDRFEPKKWYSFIFTSQLAYEMGIWPWCDVFKSGETGNMILSVLSAGVVGTGDALGKEDSHQILMACRKDGILVKPDAPLLPMDADYRHLAQGLNTPLLAETYTRQGTIRTNYVFAFQRPGIQGTRYRFRPSDLGMKGITILYDPLGQKITRLNSDSPFHGRLPERGYQYFILAPLGSCGIAMLGDTGQIVATGRERIPWMMATSKSLSLDLNFASGEGERILRGYSEYKVYTNMGKLEQDPQTHLFLLKVPASKSGKRVRIILRTRN